MELLVNPIERKFAVRPTDANNRNAVLISRVAGNKFFPREISSAAFGDTLFSIFGWNPDYKYRIMGSLYETGEEIAYIFDSADSEALFQSYVLPVPPPTADDHTVIQPLAPIGKHIRAIPEEWVPVFGKEFYLHEQNLSDLERQNEAEWKLHLEGRLFETGGRFHVTAFDELKQYIQQELGQLVRMAKDRRPGSMGYAEAMLVEYNGKKKSPAGKLLVGKLYAKDIALFDGLDSGL